jgi:hypothetical protein
MTTNTDTMTTNTDTMTTNTAAAIAAKIETMRPRGAWQKAVKLYALELLEDLDDQSAPVTLSALLNGSEDWTHYSQGGMSLIYNSQIAERVCSPSEFRRTRGGELPPNKSESWLTCQARALHQAAALILNTADQ